jgi:hypothetical protein
MPSGSSNAGLNIPNTPGSSLAGDDITWIGRLRLSGAAVRRIARMFPHNRDQHTHLIVKPQSHKPTRIAGNASAGDRSPISRAGRGGAVKGWLISSITKDNCGCLTAGAVRHPS